MVLGPEVAKLGERSGGQNEMTKLQGEALAVTGVIWHSLQRVSVGPAFACCYLSSFTYGILQRNLIPSLSQVYSNPIFPATFFAKSINTPAPLPSGSATRAGLIPPSTSFSTTSGSSGTSPRNSMSASSQSFRVRDAEPKTWDGVEQWGQV